MENIEHGVNKNHLHFKGFVPRKDSNLLFNFNYIGTKVSVSTYLPEKAKRQLTEKLADDFGCAPDNINKVKKFENGKDYIVDSVVG